MAMQRRRRRRGGVPRPLSELKMRTVGVVIDEQFNVPNFTFLSGVATGTGANQRVGLKIRARRIDMRMLWTINPTTNASGFPLVPNLLCKYTLFWFRQPNGVEPTEQQMYDAQGNVNSFLRNGQQKRFGIITEKRFVLSSSLFTHEAKENHELQIPLNIELAYGGTGDTIASVGAGHALYIMFITEGIEGVDPETYASIRMEYRFYYQDS